MLVFYAKTSVASRSLNPFRWISFTLSNFDHYKVLGVKSNATNDEIKRAYLQKCKEYHPDKNKGSKEMQSKFIQANEAYNVLSVITSRREYDARRKNFSYGSSYQPNQWSNKSQSRPEDVFRQYQQYHSRNQTRQEWSKYHKDPIYEHWQRVYKNQNYSRDQEPFGKKDPFDFQRNSTGNRMSFSERRFFIIFFSALFFIVCLRFYIAVKSYNYRSARSIPDPDYVPPSSPYSRFNNKPEIKTDISDLNVKTESA